MGSNFGSENILISSFICFSSRRASPRTSLYTCQGRSDHKILPPRWPMACAARRGHLVRRLHALRPLRPPLP